jgi:hypothetical protein
MMSLLLEFDGGDAATWAPVAEKAASLAESRGRWDIAREHWGARSKWLKRVDDTEGARAAGVRAAETLAAEADAALRRASSGDFVAAHYIARAIEAFRRLGGENARIMELHRRLISHQQAAVADMKELSAEADIGPLVRATEARFKGRPFMDSLLMLAASIRPPNKEHLRERVERHAKEFPLQHLFPLIIAGPTGLTTDTSPTISTGDPSERDKAVEFHMHREAGADHLMTVAALIEPARRVILHEHRCDLDEIAQLVESNPFVPEDRCLLVARALHAGLNGDFMVFAHLMMPQLENSIRHILKQRGVVTSTLASDGVQEERDLGALLYLPECEAILGADLTFDLRGVLIERAGSNFRHQLAHGLLSDDDTRSSVAIYLWGLSLYLCAVPHLQAGRANQKAESEEAAAPPHEESAGDSNV